MKYQFFKYSHSKTPIGHVTRLFSAIILFAYFSSAQALSWDDLWLNQDQQAYNALEQNNLQKAASLFTSTQWQGTAYYRMGDYQKALQAFMQSNDATAWYNRGNALAHLGQYEEAIRAYNQALILDTHFEDARFNRDLLQKLLSQSSSQSTPPKTSPPFKPNDQNKKDNASNGQTNTSPQNNAANASSAPQNNSSPTANTPQNLSSESTNANATTSNPPSSYQDQQQQQSLQNISDDPGGLLQRKLERDYENNQQQGD